MATADLAILITAKDDASKAIAGLNRQLGGFGDAAKAAATAATVALAGMGTAIGASLVGATKSAMDFEKTISGVMAVGGRSARQMRGELEALALQLGQETSFSATEAAEGIEELVKAGVSLSDVMGGAAKASLDLAAAGGVSVAEAATIASNAMNQFGIKGKDMAHVADVIAGAANASAIDVSEFKFSLQAAGAVAATVGFSFDDLAQAIAVMGQAGITGSDAGTSLKTMMMGLQPQTKAQTKLFQELGLMTKKGSNAFFDSSGKVKSMAEVAGILQNALKGMTEQQKLATLQTLFGSDAVRAAAVLSRAGAKGFKEMAAAMGEVTAAEVAEARLDNLAGSIEKLKGSLSTMAIRVGKAFLPALRRMADWATELVNKWTDPIAAFAERLPDAISASIQYFREFGQTVSVALNGIGRTIGSFLGLEMSDYQDGWDTWSGIFTRLRELAETAFDDLSDVVRGVSESIMDHLTQAFTVVSTYVKGIFLPVIKAAWEWLGPKLSDALDWLSGTGWPLLLSAVQRAGDWIRGTLIPTMRTLWDWLYERIGRALTWLTQTGWPLLLSAGQAVWAWINGSLVPSLASWWAWLYERIKPAFDWLIVNGWPLMLSVGSTVSAWINDTLIPALASWWGWLQERLSPVFSWFIEYAWPTLLAAGATFWAWLTESLIPKLTEWWWWLQEQIRPAVQWFIDEGLPKLSGGIIILYTAVEKLTELWQGFLKELAKTDTAESWVTILENLSKFGHWIVSNLDLAGWFSSVGSGAGEAGEQVGYVAQAIAWISRTLAKWSSFLPGVKVPDVDEPPKAPSGGGGGGGFRNGGISAPPSRSAPGGGGGGGSGGSVINPSPPSVVQPPRQEQPAPSQPPQQERGAVDNSSRSSFSRTAAPYMLEASGGNKDLASMMLAAAISEANAGSGKEILGNNFYGIKGEGPAGSHMARTWEDDNGNGRPDPGEWRDEKFASYNTPTEGMQVFMRFLQENSRYRQALANFTQSGDAVRLFKEVNEAGYATDQTWWRKVLNIRDNQVSPVVGFARGGIVTRPTMAMIGEGGANEAVIPLPRNWRNGGAALGNGGVTVVFQGPVYGLDDFENRVLQAFGQGVRRGGSIGLGAAY